MSKMMLRSNGKPPLARSPIRLRPRRVPLQPDAINTIHTPPGSMTKSQLSNRSWDDEQSRLRPEYHTISCELKALAQMVHQELGTKNNSKLDDDDSVFLAQKTPLFERGRFYDEYCARRNERLRRKKGESEKPAFDLGVRVEPAKKREASKMDSRRKTAAAAVAVAVAAASPAAERRKARSPRYSLRSSNKKPPIPGAMMNMEKSVGVGDKKVGNTRTRKA